MNTTNADKARRIIMEAFAKEDALNAATVAAKALLDAGLIMPDLPELEVGEDGFEWFGGDVMQGGKSIYVRFDSGILDVDSANELTLCLAAAVKRAKERQ